MQGQNFHWLEMEEYSNCFREMGADDTWLSQGPPLFNLIPGENPLRYSQNYVHAYHYSKMAEATPPFGFQCVFHAPSNL
jgi:hypothetical protein